MDKEGSIVSNIMKSLRQFEVHADLSNLDINWSNRIILRRDFEHNAVTSNSNSMLEYPMKEWNLNGLSNIIL